MTNVDHRGERGRGASVPLEIDTARTRRKDQSLRRVWFVHSQEVTVQYSDQNGPERGQKAIQ